MSVTRWLALVLALAACGGDDATVDDDAADGDGCEGLALGACRVTAGCMPDICDGCGCDETYRGCVDVGAAIEGCPELGCPRSVCCSSEAACETQAAACAAPGSPQGCGACNPDAGDCTTDADCTDMICEPIACSCGGSSACVPGCNDDTTCGDAEHCNVTSGRCEGDACDAGNPCPINFTCTAGACARTPCSTDGDCDGYCIESACYDQPGECRLPVP